MVVAAGRVREGGVPVEEVGLVGLDSSICPVAAL